MPVREYDPKDILVTFGEILVEGFADGTFLVVEQNEDDFGIYVGADGQATRVATNNNSAKVELTLSQSSPTNDLLSAMSKLDRKTGQGVRPLLVKDLNGQTLLLLPTAWIKRRPRREYAKTVSGRMWTFETDDILDHDGGANAPPAPA